MIKDIIEQAIRAVEAEREQKIAPAKAELMRTKIFPHNTEIDKKRDAALQEMAEKLNVDIAALRATFEREKQEIVQACEQEKKENAETVLKEELGGLTAEYDKAIAELKKQIEVKE